MITISVEALLGIIVATWILTSLVLLFTFCAGNANERNKVYDAGFAAGLKENIRKQLPKRLSPEQAKTRYEETYIHGWNSCLDKIES